MIESLKNIYVWLARPEWVDCSPRILHIETTTKCNLACIICPRTSSLKRSRNQKKLHNIGDMPLTLFSKIISECPGTRLIRLHGLGEPLMNLNLIAMISEARERGMNVEFTTNATLLSPSMSIALIQAGLFSLTISLDAATQSVYEMIRVGADFCSVVENVRQLTELKRQMRVRHPIININMVVTRFNLHEMSGVIQLCRELGAAEFRVSLLEPPELNMANWLPDRLEWAQSANSAKKLAHQLGIVMVDRGASRSLNRVNTKLAAVIRRCHRPWQSLYIRKDGYVTPCCNISDYRILGKQNIFNEGLPLIWNSTDLQMFRSQLKHGPIPEACKRCLTM